MHNAAVSWFCTFFFLYFSSSDELSWKKSRDLLEKVARQGDLTGYRVPCLLIAAKDDLTPYPRAVQDSVKVLLINQSYDIIKYVLVMYYFVVKPSSLGCYYHPFNFATGYSGIGNRGTYSRKYEIRRFK